MHDGWGVAVAGAILVSIVLEYYASIILFSLLLNYGFHLFLAYASTLFHDSVNS